MDNNATTYQQLATVRALRGIKKKYHRQGIIGLTSKNINANAVNVEGYEPT